MTTLRIKQGQTFQAGLVVRDAAGAPVNLAACQLATGLVTALGATIAGLTVTATPDAPGGAYLLAPAAATAAWPIGLLRGDVQFTGGLVTYSDTFLISVEQAVAS